MIIVATPAAADTVLHPAPEGCNLSTTGFVGSAQCASARVTFQVIVRPYYSSASCYQNAPQPYATDVWINVPD